MLSFVKWLAASGNKTGFLLFHPFFDVSIIKYENTDFTPIKSIAWELDTSLQFSVAQHFLDLLQSDLLWHTILISQNHFKITAHLLFSAFSYAELGCGLLQDVVLQ